LNSNIINETSKSEKIPPLNKSGIGALYSNINYIVGNSNQSPI
jgi:hypothetical protein